MMKKLTISFVTVISMASCANTALPVSYWDTKTNLTKEVLKKY